jgi:peroxiredoxin family protein
MSSMTNSTHTHRFLPPEPPSSGLVQGYPGLRRQRGASALGTLVIAMMALALGLFALKTGTVYFENWALKSLLKEMETDPKLFRASSMKIKQNLMARIHTNGIYHLTAKNVKIKRHNQTHMIEVKYTESKPLVGNMKVVMEFDETASIPIR